MEVAYPPDSWAGKLGYTYSVTPQREVAARCPDWCTVLDHSGEKYVEHVRHEGRRLAPLEVGQGGSVAPDRLLQVAIFAHTNSDGTPQKPVAYVQPSAEYGEGTDENPAGLRQLAQQMRAHAAAIEQLADELEELRR